MGAVADVQDQLLDRLGDEDHVVRAEAARALGTCNTPAVWQALADACSDRSVVVKEAAEESLVQLQTLAAGSGRQWRK